jgi:hypothetical protein
MVEAPLDHCYYSSGSVCHEKFEEIMPRAKGEIVLFLILIVACVK